MKNLLQLGFSQKEVEVYKALLELGTQPASVVSKKTGYPKSTVLFLFENLLSKGYIRKSQKGRIQYFYADLEDLEKVKKKELKSQLRILNQTLPLLSELKSPFTSPPKLSFFEGLDGCRKAYSMLLESKTEIFEIAAHRDLLKMGESFMSDFVKQRVKNMVFMNAISRDDEINRKIQSRDKKEFRKMYLFSGQVGDIFSSMVAFEDKLLILNLFHDPFAILIQNQEMSSTIRTYFQMMTLICKNKTKI